MSSKRHLRARSCTGKMRYTLRIEAKDAADNLNARANGRVGEYYCRFCLGFHVGHSRMTHKHARI